MGEGERTHRVPLHGELSIRLFNLSLVRRPLQTEDIVKVFSSRPPHFLVEVVAARGYVGAFRRKGNAARILLFEGQENAAVSYFVFQKALVHHRPPEKKKGRSLGRGSVSESRSHRKQWAPEVKPLLQYLYRGTNFSMNPTSFYFNSCRRRGTLYTFGGDDVEWFTTIGRRTEG